MLTHDHVSSLVAAVSVARCGCRSPRDLRCYSHVVHVIKAMFILSLSWSETNSFGLLPVLWCLPRVSVAAVLELACTETGQWQVVGSAAWLLLGEDDVGLEKSEVLG